MDKIQILIIAVECRITRLKKGNFDNEEHRYMLIKENESFLQLLKATQKAKI